MSKITIPIDGDLLFRVIVNTLMGILLVVSVFAQYQMLISSVDYMWLMVIPFFFVQYMLVMSIFLINGREEVFDKMIPFKLKGGI